MKKLALAFALVAVAGVAQAKDPSNAPQLSGFGANGVGGAGQRVSLFLNIDPSGIYSVDEYGNALNTVINYNIGAGSHVVGIGYDVTLFADSPSWLSELTVAFEDSAQTAGVFLSPGFADDVSGTATYSSGGVIDLVGLALDFNVGGDGILRTEYFEGFDDFDNDWDGIWQSGLLTVEYIPVPAPGAAGLLAVGGLVALRRRR